MIAGVLVTTQPVAQLVVSGDRAPPALVVQQPQAGLLVASGTQGPAGTTSSDVSILAGEDLGGQRVVLWQDGGLAYADPATEDPSTEPIGVTLGAASAGSMAQVRTSGVMTDPSFAFSPGGAVYLGPNGTITQSPPTAPAAQVSVVLGMALSAQSILIRISQPITLI